MPFCQLYANSASGTGVTVSRRITTGQWALPCSGRSSRVLAQRSLQRGKLAGLKRTAHWPEQCRKANGMKERQLGRCLPSSNLEVTSGGGRRQWQALAAAGLYQNGVALVKGQ